MHGRVAKHRADIILLTIVFNCLGPQTNQLKRHDKAKGVVTMHAFPTADPNVCIEPLSDDPMNNNFLGFRILAEMSRKELSRYRASDVIQMRCFMASLGATGPGIFSVKPAGGERAPIETIRGLWDVIHPSDPTQDELIERHETYDSRAQESTTAKEGKGTPSSEATLPSYDETIQRLPTGFYFTEEKNSPPCTSEGVQSSLLGAPLPIYDPSFALPKSSRRPQHDTFRPPYGPPISCPISLGYGPEVGLEPGIQALWNPKGNTYFFLDHIRQTTFFDDPRPAPKPVHVPNKYDFVYGDQHGETNVPLGVCRVSTVIVAAARRALNKEHGFTINASGANGSDGPDGHTGQQGGPGYAGGAGGTGGAYGAKGGNGSPGCPGYDGISGTHGTAASDVNLRLEGSVDELRVIGRFHVTACLGDERCEEVLFVDCSGGNGAHGGDGGVGGLGGEGGRGGFGAPGQMGYTSYTGSGGDGGNGGTGGDGGKGGEGGPGGRGGDGGSAGFGGVCVFCTTKPELLVLVEADCRCGDPGKGGNSGAGGTGGRGGRGGEGGQGGIGGSGENGMNGRRGSHGNDGANGNDGARGKDGVLGRDGMQAPNGGILWVVNTPDGQILHQAGARYEAHVTKLIVVSAIDDGIFEPNERIAVSGVVVTNTGGLPLPSGTQALIPSTGTIKFEPTRFTFPTQLLPNQEIVIPITFYGRIFDQPPPSKPGPFVSSAKFATRVELLGRPFIKSHLTETFAVQYPVKLDSIRCNENMGRGEVNLFEIDVRNVSSMPYGDCAKSGGSVTLRLHLDARLIPVGPASPASQSPPYTITYDHSVRDSVCIRMHEIPPGKVVTVQVAVQIESQAELFERCYWQADLCLRGKVIEYNFQNIRVSPFYIPTDPPADMLLITGPEISRKEFVFWQRILETLEVTVDFWDVSRYNGLSFDFQTNTQHPVTWEGRYAGRTIVYPHCNLKFLSGMDIARHFHGSDLREGDRKDLGSGMVLFLPAPPPDTSAFVSRAFDRDDAAVMRHLALVDDPLELPPRCTYSGWHFSTPTSATGLKWEEKTLKKFEKANPSRSVTVVRRRVNIESTGVFRYSYGEVDLRCCPLLHSCKFVTVGSASGSIVNITVDDIGLSPASVKIPIASNYGQVLLATLFGISLSHKLKLIKVTAEEPSDRSQSANPTFCLPNGFTLSKAELSAICAAREIAEEVLSCTGTLDRMQAFASDVVNNISAYSPNGKIVFQTTQLIEKELADFKKLKNSRAKRASLAIKQQIKCVQQALRESNIDIRKVSQLPRLCLLQQSGRMLRSHQYFMKDERWNLA